MEIRRSYDRFISTMGFPILVGWHFYIESVPWSSSCFHSFTHALTQTSHTHTKIMSHRCKIAVDTELYWSVRQKTREIWGIWVNLGQNRWFFSRVTLKFDRWPWKTMGTSSMLLQTLCIISPPLVNSNWSCSLETPNLGQNRRFLSRVVLTFDGWPWKTKGPLF